MIFWVFICKYVQLLSLLKRCIFVFLSLLRFFKVVLTSFHWFNAKTFGNYFLLTFVSDCKNLVDCIQAVMFLIGFFSILLYVIYFLFFFIRLFLVFFFWLIWVFCIAFTWALWMCDLIFWLFLVYFFLLEELFGCRYHPLSLSLWRLHKNSVEL